MFRIFNILNIQPFELHLYKCENIIITSIYAYHLDHKDVMFQYDKINLKFGWFYGQNKKLKQFVFGPKI
jgi:hypothetical protein